MADDVYLQMGHRLKNITNQNLRWDSYNTPDRVVTCNHLISWPLYFGWSARLFDSWLAVDLGLRVTCSRSVRCGEKTRRCHASGYLARLIRTLSVVASVSDVRHCRVAVRRRKERNADNIMYTGSNTAATIVCVKWRRAKKGDYSALFAFVICWEALRYCASLIKLLD